MRHEAKENCYETTLVIVFHAARPLAVHPLRFHGDGN
jgi:hypothetical protein